jgi:hypothetical protein
MHESLLPPKHPRHRIFSEHALLFKRALGSKVRAFSTETLDAPDIIKTGARQKSRTAAKVISAAKSNACNTLRAVNVNFPDFSGFGPVIAREVQT